MNSTKNKLFAAIAMLIVAAVAMTGTSFAWFTISTAPRVDNLEVSMAATHNFEIAAISGSATTAPSEPAPGDATTGQTQWGATVKFSSSSALVFPMTVTSAGQGADKNQSIYYDSTGRVDGVRLCSLGAFNTSGVAVYYANISSTAAAGSEQWVTCGAVYGVWLRSNIGVSCSVSMGGLSVKNAAGEDVYGDNGVTWIDQYASVDANAAAANARVASAATVSLEFLSGTQTPGQGTVLTSGAIMTMQANVPYRVLVTVFFDGEQIFARDIAKGLKVENFNVEFINKGSDKFGTNESGSTWNPLQNY